MGMAMMANLNQSRNLAPFCGYNNSILANKPLNVFYQGVFYTCGRYVKILETVRDCKPTIYTLYLREFDEGRNGYVDLYFYGKEFYLGLGCLQKDISRQIGTFVEILCNYINNVIGKSGCFAEHIKDIRRFWLGRGYYFHKSVFKFLLSIYISKHQVWIAPYTPLYNASCNYLY